MFFAAFGSPQRQVSVLEVVGCDFENLANPHYSPIFCLLNRHGDIIFRAL
jgi:hypothetical protein